MKKRLVLLLLIGINLGAGMVTKANIGNPPVQQMNSIVPGPVSGPAAVCLNQTGVNYSVAVQPGVLSYNWTVPSNATITAGQGTASITVSFTTDFGDICVSADDGSGFGAPSCLTTFQALTKPATPISINGQLYTVCPGQVHTYTVNADPLATSYSWVVPNDMTILSGQGTYSINVQAGPNFVWGTMRVSASNCKGNTGQYSVGIYSAPGKPGGISGPPVGACPNGTYTYSIAPVHGATSYTWWAPAGCIITSPAASGNPLTTSVTSVDITFSAGFTNGSIFVCSNSGCNSSEKREMQLRSVPQKPNGIRGPFYGVCNMSNVMYYIDSVPGATSYTWSFSPAGTANIIDNGNDTVYVDFLPGFTQGTFCVTANNACGSSVSRCGVVWARPQIPGAISGPIGACNTIPAASIAFYEIQPVFGASNYQWNVPPGAVITQGQGTRMITVNYMGASSGDVSVRTENACGYSPYRTLAITVNPCRMGSFSGSISSSGLNVYPVPARDILNVELPQSSGGTVIIKMMDLTGRIVYSAESTGKDELFKEKIILDKFSRGIYILECTADGISQNRKIVIE